MHTQPQLEALKSRIVALERLLLSQEKSLFCVATRPSLEHNEFTLLDHSSNAPLAEICGTSSGVDVLPGIFQPGGHSPRSSAFGAGANPLDDTQGRDQREEDIDFDALFDFHLTTDPRQFDAQFTSAPLRTSQSHDLQAADVASGTSTTIPATMSPSCLNNYIPAASVPAAVPPPSRRFPCTICGKMFGRTGDLGRHALKHNPNARRYPCPEPSCKFSGANGMLRKDKLQEHRDRYGH